VAEREEEPMSYFDFVTIVAVFIGIRYGFVCARQICATNWK
jgi:hypothetical protein